MLSIISIQHSDNRGIEDYVMYITRGAHAALENLQVVEKKQNTTREVLELEFALDCFLATGFGFHERIVSKRGLMFKSPVGLIKNNSFLQRSDFLRVIQDDS